MLPQTTEMPKNDVCGRRYPFIPLIHHQSRSVYTGGTNSCCNSVTLKHGALCDIAPTMLSVMGMEIPAEMTGKVLVQNK